MYDKYLIKPISDRNYKDIRIYRSKIAKMPINRKLMNGIKMGNRSRFKMILLNLEPGKLIRAYPTSELKPYSSRPYNA